MVQKVQVMLVDDLDGGEAEETVAFSIDGVHYEIDLSAANAATLRDQLTPFLQAARKASRAKRAGGKGARSKLSRINSNEVRLWAKENGKSISERGRIPQAIVDEYQAATV